ncbi:hypothetical protein [uncultured Maribacter sp.]|uniref:hypothetical protein n=1 Tax=uncultured Maribacter sp. TaxID=431308 RepID=UPI00261CB124|nr:hypothetical protein [uncultured Maribacter sp.]
MKKVFSFLTILAIILVSNCSRIEDNNDPVIGVWSNATTSTNSTTQKLTTNKQEWIFNDAYLGRYHDLQNGKVIMKTDFKWSQKDGVYTISYPGLPDKPTDTVIIVDNSPESVLLEDPTGNLIALRE